MPPNDPVAFDGSDHQSQSASLEADLSQVTAQPTAVDNNDLSRLYEHKQRQRRLVRFGLLGLLSLAIIGALVVILFRSDTPTNAQMGNFPVTRVQLPTLPKTTLT